MPSVSSFRLAPGTQDQFVFPGNDHGEGCLIGLRTAGWCEIWVCSRTHFTVQDLPLLTPFDGQLGLSTRNDLLPCDETAPRNLLELSTVMDQPRPTLSWLWVGSLEFFNPACSSLSYLLHELRQVVTLLKQAPHPLLNGNNNNSADFTGLHSQGRLELRDIKLDFCTSTNSFIWS